MSLMQPITKALIDCREASLVGGKAANLGRLARMGFAVPEGFVVTTRAYRSAQKQSSPALPSLPLQMEVEIRWAYHALGRGAVAVRSSATAEDMAGASMAGQYETFLNIQGEDALLDAVNKCWASLDSPRTRAYLRERNIDPGRVAMAVVVQRLVPADVAGVLFTVNPHNGDAGQMLLEASWGLGESVVSGRVQPDVLRLEQETGRVLSASIADKRVHRPAGAGGDQAVEESRRTLACLRSRDVHRLWQMGRRVAGQFGSPQDIEWAIHDGELFVLQSRPITTLARTEAYEQVLRSTRQFLREQTKIGRGPWVLHNLAETLPHPTPLTWSVICRFMSGSGGFGAMYRQVGFDPSPAVSRDGFLDNIGGRIYMDASRAGEMFFADFPFGYCLEELKRSPDASQTPPTVPRGSFTARIRAVRRLMSVNAKLTELSADFDRRLNDDIFPAFAAWCAGEKQRDLAGLTPQQLDELWQQRERLVLDEFAPQSLLPSLISAMALAELRTFLAENFWNDDPDALSQLISSGGPPNRTVIGDAELHEVGRDQRPLERWIADHGHRAPGEFDLAAARWRERPGAAREMALRLAGGDGPLERNRRHAEEVNQRIDALGASLAPGDRAELTRLIDRVRRYVAFREDGKDFLMLGYDLLRDIALEAGRRLEVGEDIFFLTREDLFDAVRVGFAPHQLIDERKIAHQAQARLTLPRVIDASSIDAIGEAREVKTAGGYKAFAVSTGRACGPARVRHSPTEAGDLGSGYVLVCPSTDPSWTPLFVNAAGVVLECGGTLSHGAVVAREMGVPAVVLPDATRLFADGEEIRVDGSGGSVSRAAEDAARAEPPEVGSDTGTTVSLRGAALSPSPGTPGEGWGEGLLIAPEQKTVTPALSRSTGRGSKTFGRQNRALHPSRPAPEASVPAADPDDIAIPYQMVPPPAGRKDRTAAKVRNVCAIGWSVYFLAAYLLPQRWVYQPSLTALDLLLWPIARGLGKPAVVAIVAAAMACLSLVIQKLITDNPRLLEAKARAAALTRQARSLPARSPRRTSLMRLAGPVQWRTLLAALAPIAILLGPMVMTCFWFLDRVDTDKWNAEPGTPVMVVATVDSAWTGPVTLELPPSLQLDDAAPAARTLPPIRKTLEGLRALLMQPRIDAGAPWQMQFVPDVNRDQTLASLDTYLDGGVPPQGLTWQVRPADENLTGRFPITVTAGARAAGTASLVLGDTYPPSPSHVDGAEGSPVKSLAIKYPPRKTKPVFWRPLAFLEHFPRIPFASRLAALQLGWLAVYVLAYLPALFLLRWILRLA